MDHMDHLVWPVVWFGPSVTVDVVTNGSIMDHRDHLVWSVVLLLWSPENSHLLVWWCGATRVDHVLVWQSL